MRTGLFAALLTLLIVGAASADTDVSITVGATSGSYDYHYSQDWWWGDGVIYGDWDYSRRGMYTGYRDGDWDSRYSHHNPPPVYYSGGDTYYDGSTHPNDRGGYRVFIPRGLEGPPEYFGDYSSPGPVQHYPRSGYGGVVILKPNVQYPHSFYPYPYYPPTYYPGSTVVINPAPQYTPRGEGCSTYERNNRGPRPLYTAQAQPGYSDDWDYGIDNSQPQVVNDNRTYNIYYGDVENNQQAEPRQPAREPRLAERVEPEHRPAQPQQQPTLAPRAKGAAFDTSLRLETAGGAYRFELAGSDLYAGLEDGAAQLVSTGADTAFGAFAANVPGEGLSLVYREGSSIVAAYPTDGGEWWYSELPYKVDFGSPVSIGMVSGMPWVTFNSRGGGRYVVAFTSRLWVEVGSGS